MFNVSKDHLSDQQFQNLFSQKPTSALVERRGVSLRQEITSDLELSLPVNEKLNFIAKKIQIFSEFSVKTSASLQKDVNRVVSNLMAFVQDQAAPLLKKENAAAQSRVRAFQDQVIRKAEQILDLFKKNLANPNASILQLLANAKEQGCALTELECPLLADGGAQMIEKARVTLGSALEETAVKAQRNRVNQAFKKFMGNAGRLKAVHEFLMQTKNGFSERPREIVQQLKDAQFVIPDPEAYERRRFSQEKGAFDEELDALQAMCRQQELPEFAEKTKKVEQLLEVANTTRNCARNLLLAKEGSAHFVEQEPVVIGLLNEMELLLNALQDAISNYDEASVDRLFGELQEKHEKITEGLDGLKADEHAFRQAFPERDQYLNGHGFRILTSPQFSRFSGQGVQYRKLVEQLEKLQQLENRFELGDFELISMDDFSAAGLPFYQKLVGVVSERLKPLVVRGSTEEEVKAARVYRKKLMSWLKQVTIQVASHFAMEVLRPTVKEKLMNLLKFLAALFTCCFKSRSAVVEERRPEVQQPAIEEDVALAVEDVPQVRIADMLSWIDGLQEASVEESEVEESDLRRSLLSYYSASAV